MSIKCNKCENKVFDSNAYLKISQIERDHIDDLEKSKKRYDEARKKYDTNSPEVKIAMEGWLFSKALLEVVHKCKNCL